MDMQAGAALFRVLGDDARLRLLRLVAAERLNVTELTGILGIAQSGVSRHLGLLKDAGLVVEERGAGYTYFRLPEQPAAGPLAPLWSLLQMQFETLNGHEAAWKADDARLQEVLRLRKEN